MIKWKSFYYKKWTEIILRLLDIQLRARLYIISALVLGSVLVSGSGTVSPARPRARRWCWLQAVGWRAAGRKVSRPLAQVSAARSPYLSLSCRAGPSQISEGCLSFTRGLSTSILRNSQFPTMAAYDDDSSSRESGCLRALCMLKSIPSASPQPVPTLYPLGVWLEKASSLCCIKHGMYYCRSFYIVLDWKNK